MKNKKNIKKIDLSDEAISTTTKEYTTKELIELGKKMNVLKLARPLYEEDENKNKKIKS